jgi:hypothetical protein
MHTIYPNNNATLSYPANDSVVTNPSQILRINAATDPDSDELQYNFVLADNNGTIVQQSGWSNSLAMPIADGVLQDGINYTWKVYVKDSYYAYSSRPYQRLLKWTLDRKDTSQAYDEAGPFAANLATGNAYTANSSHSINALGGSIGIGLEYNSPVLAKEGLSAKYWNNTTWSGDPNYSRIDSKVDFDWNTASPFPGIINGDFSASWSGYYIAPVTGAYKFGTDADDAVNLYSNGTALMQVGCCGMKWMSSTVDLTAGQAYPSNWILQHLGS